MQKSLLRQLKRSMGIRDEAAFGELLQQLPALAQAGDPRGAELLSGFGAFVAQVDSSYERPEPDDERCAASPPLDEGEGSHGAT
mgnify:CR=1 FL=1